MSMFTGAVADVAIFAIAALVIWCGAKVGAFVDRKIEKRWLAWTVGLSVAAAIFAAGAPSIRALTGVQCQGDTDCAAGD